MKILFITSRLPYPPYRGDKLRTFSFIKELSRTNEIYLVSFYETRRERNDLKQLEQFCKKIYIVYLPKWMAWLKVIVLFFSAFPSQTAYYRSNRMKKIIAQITREEKFDMAYIHLFRMFQYFNSIPDDVYVVDDFTDVISKEMFRSIGNREGLLKKIVKREAMKIRRYEQMVVSVTDETWVISEQEKNDLVASSNSGLVTVVKNGINIHGGVRRLGNVPNILFFGYYNNSHNKDALKFLKDRIIPEVAKLIPEISLTVFGAGKWRISQKRQSEFPINYLGFVPNLGDVFNLATVMVAPILYSAGTQNKILEAMNYGVPVITSNFGNEGIEAMNGTEIIICNNPEDYVEQICRIIKDKSLNNSIGRNGQKHVQANFSWEYVTKRVREIEKTLIAQNLKAKL